MHVQHPHTPHHHPLAHWRLWILTFSHIKHRHTAQFCGLGLEASLRCRDINWFCHQSYFNVQNDTTCPGWGHCPPTWCKDTVWVELTVSHPHKSLKETNRGFWFMRKRLSDKRTCTSVTDTNLAWSCSESPPRLWVCGATWVFLLSPLGCPGVDIPHKRTAPSCPTPHERTVQMTGTESRLSAYLPGMERDSVQFTISESFSSWASHWKIKVKLTLDARIYKWQCDATTFLFSLPFMFPLIQPLFFIPFSFFFLVEWWWCHFARNLSLMLHCLWQ